MVAVPKADDLRRVLDDDGEVLPGVERPDLPAADLKHLYRTMLFVRVLDERMIRLQRQGRLGFYMQAFGEEATHMAVYFLRESDWVFPSYREQGAFFLRGYTVKEFLSQLYGTVNDPAKGRQMPVHHTCRRINFVSISSPVGTQIPQATGMAMAARIAGRDDVALTYFGEGTTSTGDFHVAMNFAGVFKAPVIFLCRNNGWAISVPRERQTASKTFAQKALAYGMPGVRVDGNDLLAILQVTSEAVARARRGDGPTLIEALTYRRGGHSTSDDPSVYRNPDEPRQWEPKDPIERFRRYLEKQGLWSEAWEREMRAEMDATITQANAEASAEPAPPVETLFEDVYEELPWHLEEQRSYLLEQPRTKNPHVH